MRAGVVQILTLCVKLHVADLSGEPLQVRNRGRTALKLPADTAQFADKFAGFTDGEIGFGDLFHRLFEFFGDVHAAVFSEIAVFIRIIFKIGVKINAVINHSSFLQDRYRMYMFLF